MPETGSKIHTDVDIIDDRFAQKESPDYTLALIPYSNRLVFSIVRPEDHTLLLLKGYHYQKEDPEKTLSELLDADPLFGLPYKQIKIGLPFVPSILMPNTIYQSAQKNDYLNYITTTDSEEAIGTDFISTINAYHLYSTPSSIQEKLNAIFPDIDFYHVSSALIQTLTEQQQKDEKAIYADIHFEYLRLLAFSGRQLYFHNIFSFRTPEDFIYYILLIYEQLQLSPEKVPLVFLGTIQRSSPLYQISTKYVRTIKFGKRPPDLKYSTKFKRPDEHLYTNSYSLQLCE